MFDSLAYAKQLEEVGVPREQAERFAQLQQKTIEELQRDLATKQDLGALKADLLTVIPTTKAELLTAIGEVKTSVANTRTTLTWRFLGAFAALLIVIAHGFGWLR